MNRGYSYTPREQPRSPPPRGRLLSQDSNRASSFRNQATVKQDLPNIDEFGDMDSDEDDFQALGSNFVSPKPPAKPQYNLVPYGFLQDDDELVEEDHDGVPIDDRVLQDSLRKQSWQSSSHKPPSEEIRGDPISILGSSNRHDSNLPVWPNDTRNQDRVPRNHQGLGSSSVNSNVIGISGSREQLGAGRWDQKKASHDNSGNIKNIPSQMGTDVRKEQNFVQSQDDANRFIQSISRQTSSLSTTSFVRGTNDSNPFIKTPNLHASSGNATSFVPAKYISNSFLKSDSTPHWNAKPNIAQSSTPAWAQQGRDSSQNLKGQVLSDQNQMFTPTNIANTTPQIELLQQAAALQQVLTGLTQLGSQSGLNLLGAQNLLMQASQNPTLAAALVGTGLSSIQPNTSSNPSVECSGKFAITTAAPVTQSNVSVLKNQSRSNIIVNSSSSSHKMPMPDGSGATRYPAPDVSSLVFDPSTGYRFDASTGLHYEANSGYFFNSELKIYLRWDKFIQTYSRVDNPPGVPRFSDSSTDRMSNVKGLSLASQDSGQQSSSFSNIPLSKESIRSSNTFSTGGFAKECHHGLPSLMNVPTSSFQKERNTMHPSKSTIPTDFLKPPPLSQPPLSDSRFQQSGANPVSAAEQKAAALPNFAETSLLNKLRKAKLALTSQAKSDCKRWGSPGPLFEAAQKHAVETNKSEDDVLNLKEIIQCSRPFMNQKTGKTLNAFDESADRQIQKGRSRSRSGDRRKNRSHSQSVGRPLRGSRSPARPGSRHGRSDMSPQPRRPLAKSSDGRLREQPNSRGRSPNSRGRGRQSPSPANKRRSSSRGRSPINRAHGRVSPSSKARKRRPTSRGRSPLKRRGKFSKSPDSRQKTPISRGKSPVRRPRGRLSISPSLRKTVHHSLTPTRSQSPKVNVVLNQSPGGSKIRVLSPERNNKRSADRGLSAERRPIRRKLSPSCVKSPERTRASSPARKDMKNSVDDKTGIGGRKSIKERLGVHENGGESLEKDQITDLKPIPYETPQNSSKKPSGSNRSKDVSGFKSLSNLRNQAKEKIRQKVTDKKLDNSHQHNVKSSAGTISTLVDLTLAADYEKRSRGNFRLVSERTFSSGWERKKPDSVSQVLSVKKTDNNTEARPMGKDTKEDVNEDEKKPEEPDEYDFDSLNDTLDDDNESTVIDEYEEIRPRLSRYGFSKTPDRKSLPVLASSGKSGYCVYCRRKGHTRATCFKANKTCYNCGLTNQHFAKDCPHPPNACLGDRSVASQGEEEVGEEDGLELHDSEGLDVVTDNFSESVELSEPQSPKDNSSGLEEKPEIPIVGICEKKGSSKSDVVPPTQDEISDVTAQTKVVGGKLHAVDTATEIKKSRAHDTLSRYGFSKTPNRKSLPALASSGKSGYCVYCRRKGHTRATCFKANKTCYNCGLTNQHFAKDCPHPPNACLGDRSVASQGEEEVGEEAGLELHDSEGLDVVTDNISESVELSEPQSPKDNSSGLEEKPEIPIVGICEKKGSSKSDVVPPTQDEISDVTAQNKVVGGKLHAVDTATEIKKSRAHDRLSRYGFSKTPNRKSLPALASSKKKKPGYCVYCHRPGHTKEICFKANKTCFNCGLTNQHSAKDCPHPPNAQLISHTARTSVNPNPAPSSTQPKASALKRPKLFKMTLGQAKNLAQGFRSQPDSVFAIAGSLDGADDSLVWVTMGDEEERAVGTHNFVSECQGQGSVSQLSEGEPCFKAIVDSGCTEHLTCDKTKKPDNNTEARPSGKDTKEDVNEDEKKIEEPDEYDFDFLNATLDDDNESTVIDEYEEILDYQDLEGLSEVLEKESASTGISKPDSQGEKKTLRKESLGSPVIDLCIDPNEPTIEVSTSAESSIEVIRVQCSHAENSELEIPSGKPNCLGDRSVASQGEEEVGEEEGLELHDSEGLEVVTDNFSESVELSEPESLKDNSSGLEEKPEVPKVGICEKKGSSKSDVVPPTQDEISDVTAQTKILGGKLHAVDTATEIKKSRTHDTLSRYGFSKTPNRKSLPALASSKKKKPGYCVYCHRPGHTKEICFKANKTCFNCGLTNQHSAKDCPHPPNAQLVSHTARTSVNPNPAPRSTQPKASSALKRPKLFKMPLGQAKNLAQGFRSQPDSVFAIAGSLDGADDSLVWVTMGDEEEKAVSTLNFVSEHQGQGSAFQLSEGEPCFKAIVDTGCMEHLTCDKTKKTDNNTEARPSGKDTKEDVNEDEKKIEEPDEYNFDSLNDSLDDDNESTVIDEYEEILDYQDLEGLSEVLEKESASTGIAKPDSQGVKKTLRKESIGSPVIDLCIDPNEPAIEVSTSAESSIEVIRVQCSCAENSELEIPPGKPNCLGDRSVASQGEEEVGEEEGLELHDSEGLEVVTDNSSESVELSEPQSPKELLEECLIPPTISSGGRGRGGGVTAPSFSKSGPPKPQNPPSQASTSKPRGVSSASKPRKKEFCIYCKRPGHNRAICHRANNLCFNCGLTNQHVAQDCPNPSNVTTSSRPTLPTSTATRPSPATRSRTSFAPNTPRLFKMALGQAKKLAQQIQGHPNSVFAIAGPVDGDDSSRVWVTMGHKEEQLVSTINFVSERQGDGIVYQLSKARTSVNPNPAPCSTQPKASSALKRPKLFKMPLGQAKNLAEGFRSQPDSVFAIAGSLDSADDSLVWATMGDEEEQAISTLNFVSKREGQGSAFQLSKGGKEPWA